MSTTTHEIAKAADLQFALKGIAPGTPIKWADRVGDDYDGDTLVIELTWAGKPENAHFIRIGPGGMKE